MNLLGTQLWRKQGVLAVLTSDEKHPILKKTRGMLIGGKVIISTIVSVFFKSLKLLDDEVFGPIFLLTGLKRNGDGGDCAIGEELGGR